MKLTHMATVTLLAVVAPAGSLSIEAQDEQTISVTAPGVGTVAMPSEDGVARRTGQVIQINFRNFPLETETDQWFRRTPKKGDVRLQVELFDRSGSPVAPGEFRLSGGANRQAVLRITDHQSSSLITIPPASTGAVTVKRMDDSGISGSISFTSPDSSVNGSFTATFK